MVSQEQFRTAFKRYCEMIDEAEWRLPVEDINIIKFGELDEASLIDLYGKKAVDYYKKEHNW